MFTEEKLSAFVETESFSKINKASNKAIETINYVLTKKNRGQLNHDEIEATLIMLVAKYFQTLVHQHGASDDVRERLETFLEAVLEFRERLFKPEEEPSALEVR